VQSLEASPQAHSLSPQEAGQDKSRTRTTALQRRKLQLALRDYEKLLSLTHNKNSAAEASIRSAPSECDNTLHYLLMKEHVAVEHRGWKEENSS
jgi:hypothetical protein